MASEGRERETIRYNKRKSEMYLLASEQSMYLVYGCIVFSMQTSVRDTNQGYKFELYGYKIKCLTNFSGSVLIYMYVCHNSGACHAYVLWAELGHSHFLYVLAVSNVVTTGNRH